MIFLAAVCMHERNIKKHIPVTATEEFYQLGAGRQFIILKFDHPSEKIWSSKLVKTLTKSGCHVSVEDNLATAQEKVEKAMKFHRIEVDNERSRPIFSESNTNV